MQVDGNISCSQTYYYDGIESKIDTLEAELGEKLNEVLDGLHQQFNRRNKNASNRCMILCHA